MLVSGFLGYLTYITAVMFNVDSYGMSNSNIVKDSRLLRTLFGTSGYYLDKDHEIIDNGTNLDVYAIVGKRKILAFKGEYYKTNTTLKSCMTHVLYDEQYDSVNGECMYFNDPDVVKNTNKFINKYVEIKNETIDYTKAVSDAVKGYNIKDYILVYRHKDNKKKLPSMISLTGYYGKRKKEMFTLTSNVTFTNQPSGV